MDAMGLTIKTFKNFPNKNEFFFVAEERDWRKLSKLEPQVNMSTLDGSLQSLKKRCSLIKHGITYMYFES